VVFCTAVFCHVGYLSRCPVTRFTGGLTQLYEVQDEEFIDWNPVTGYNARHTKVKQSKFSSSGVAFLWSFDPRPYVSWPLVRFCDRWWCWWSWWLGSLERDHVVVVAPALSQATAAVVDAGPLYWMTARSSRSYDTELDVGDVALWPRRLPPPSHDILTYYKPVSYHNGQTCPSRKLPPTRRTPHRICSDKVLPGRHLLCSIFKHCK